MQLPPMEQKPPVLCLQQHSTATKQPLGTKMSFKEARECLQEKVVMGFKKPIAIIAVIVITTVITSLACFASYAARVVGGIIDTNSIEFTD